MIDRSAA